MRFVHWFRRAVVLALALSLLVVSVLEFAQPGTEQALNGWTNVQLGLHPNAQGGLLVILAVAFLVAAPLAWRIRD